MTSPEGAVWYAAYGSNLLRSRFLSYLEGNDHELYGSHIGARNPAPPAADRLLELDHRIYFAGRSVRWKGASVTFIELEPDPAWVTHARGYLLEWTQLEDVLAQENGLAPGRLTLPELPTRGSFLELETTAKYNALLRFDDADGIPVVTGTTLRAFDRGTPDPRYVETIRAGLLELGIEPSIADAYLASVE